MTNAYTTSQVKIIFPLELYVIIIPCHCQILLLSKAVKAGESRAMKLKQGNKIGEDNEKAMQSFILMFGDVSSSGEYSRARMRTKTDLIGPEMCANSTCLSTPTPCI